MQAVHDDVIIRISDELTDREKIILTLTSKSMGIFRCKFMYHEKICVDRIISLPYYDNFRCIDIRKMFERPDAKSFTVSDYPKYVKEVHYMIHYDDYFTDISAKFVLHRVTHLKFSNVFNETICGVIPPSVTHLTFGTWFNQSVSDHIPSSVTHLTFGKHFNQPITCILSVTHLTFGANFNHPLKHNIPFVTHLTLGKKFIQPIENISSSVTHLKFLDMPKLIEID
uniref:F-box and FNIP repeat-containing protein n=1 Tax=viral metagenome TaxID=1070528 RepID=A0A6C0C877_9ZZZZ